MHSIISAELCSGGDSRLAFYYAESSRAGWNRVKANLKSRSARHVVCLDLFGVQLALIKPEGSVN
jgi:hypothetical protein